MGQSSSSQARPNRPPLADPPPAESVPQPALAGTQLSRWPAWDRFAERCARTLRRGRYSSTVARPAVPSRDVALRIPTRDRAPPLNPALPNASAQAESAESVGGPAPPAGLPPPPPPLASGSIREGSVMPPLEAADFTNPDNDSLWTDLGAHPSVPSSTPPRDQAEGPAQIVSQVLALAASITARQLFGYRPDSARDDQFTNFLDSLYNGFQSSDVNSMFAQRGDDDDDDDDDDNDGDDGESDDSESPRHSHSGDSMPQSGHSDRPGYFRMFRFRETDSGLVPVIVVSMRPADLESMSELAHPEVVEAMPEEVPWPRPPAPTHSPPEPPGEDSATPLLPRRSPPLPPPLQTHIEVEQSEEHPQTPSSRPRSVQASWIIYVWGGTYPRNHPIFMAPSLLTDDPTYEDLMYIQELMGQHKPPVASQTELDKLGGVFTVESGAPILGDRCAVCLSQFAEGDVCRRLTCQHEYHQLCVDKWLSESQNTCPLCREIGAPKQEA